MNKKEVQKRVSQYGKPLPLELFTWDETNRTFPSNEGDLVIDFTDVDGTTFRVGNFCHISAWHENKIYAGGNCTFWTGEFNEFHTGSYCTFNVHNKCKFYTGSFCTFNITDNCRIKTSGKCVVLVQAPFQIIQINDDEEIYIPRTVY